MPAFQQWRVDLGAGHVLTFTSQYGRPDNVFVGAIVAHPRADDPTQACTGGYVWFTPHAPPGQPSWDVLSWAPVTLSPSLSCPQCGDHGYVRNGNWVPA